MRGSIKSKSVLHNNSADVLFIMHFHILLQFLSSTNFQQSYAVVHTEIIILFGRLCAIGIVMFMSATGRSICYAWIGTISSTALRYWFPGLCNEGFHNLAACYFALFL